MTRRAASALLAVVAAVVLGASTARAAEPQARDLTPMFRDGGVKVDGLEVIEIGGIVVIRGTTTDQAGAAAAGLFAAEHGFTRVANLVQISQPVDDAAIQRRAERELAVNGGLDGCKVRLSAHNGIIHIAGQVHADEQKDTLVRLLRTIDGVKGVTSDLTRF